MKRIMTREDMKNLADQLGVRPDWHEPDEQEVEAWVLGKRFDNAGFWGSSELTHKTYEEQHVILVKDGEPVAAVNLATLFAWASH